MRIFAHSSDSVLSKIRSAFTDAFPSTAGQLDSSFEEEYIKADINNYPADTIIEKLGDDWYISETKIEELITTTQKGERYSLPLLSLLFPDYNINGVNFEQDHLHPMNRIPEDYRKDRDKKKLYNSIVNLHLLEKGKNVQKSDKPLKSWVDEICKNYSVEEKNRFFAAHYIPNDSLDEKDIDKFFTERKIYL